METTPAFQHNTMTTNATMGQQTDPPPNNLISNYLNSTEQPTLQEFIEKHKNEIVNLTAKNTDARRVWSGRYSMLARNLKKPCILGEPNWFELLASVEDQEQSNSSRTPTAMYQQQMEALYSTMVADSKWELPSGQYVEDLMIEHARTVDHEHALHSFILDPTETRWEDVFSPEDLDYVKTHNAPAFPDVSPTNAVEEYFSSFTSEMDTYDKIMTHVATHQVFQCNEDFGVTWARQSITNHMMNYAAKKKAGTLSENDMILRTWSPAIYSFDDTAVRVQMREKENTMTSTKKNSDRTRNKQKLHGSRVDMRFLWDNFELGCSKVGKDDKGKYDTKEMRESQLKCPKMLRDMLAMLSISFPDEVPKLRTFAYIMMGNTISLEVMDCPKKYVCRITRSSRFTFSDDIEAYVTRTLPILRLYLDTKQMMIEVVEALRHSALPRITLSPNVPLPVPFALVSSSSAPTSSSATSSPSTKRQKVSR